MKNYAVVSFYFIKLLMLLGYKLKPTPFLALSCLKSDL